MIFELLSYIILLHVQLFVFSRDFFYFFFGTEDYHYLVEFSFKMYLLALLKKKNTIKIRKFNVFNVKMFLIPFHFLYINLLFISCSYAINLLLFRHLKNVGSLSIPYTK